MPNWRHGTAVAAIASTYALASCASDSTESNSHTTTVTASSTFDPCSNLTPEFIETYALQTPGKFETQSDIQMCKYDITVADHSWLYVGLYDPSKVKPNEIGLPPTRAITVSGHQAERIGWREYPGNTGKTVCSIKVHLDQDDLIILYSNGLSPRPDDDHTCRQAVAMAEDIVRMIEGHK